MTKRKILFFITKSNFGGAQKHVLDLARSISGPECETVVALGGNGALVGKLQAVGVRHISLPRLVRDVSIWKDFLVLANIYNCIRRESPDVLHLHSSKAGAMGALAGRLAGVRRIVFTAHGWAFNEPRGLFWRFAVVLMSWLTAVLSHSVIVICKKEFDQSKRFPFCKRKIAYVPNGIELPDFLDRAASRNYLEARTGVSMKDKIVVGVIAELHRNKGLRYGIEALRLSLAKCQSLVYVIMGEGEERRVLEEVIRERGLDGKVFLLGYVQDAPIYVKAFDIFMLSSVKEGLPYVLLEAGASGVACVATAVGGVADCIDDKVSGLIVPRADAVALADALVKLGNSAETRNNYGRAFKAVVQKEFTLGKMVDRTTAVYFPTGGGGARA